MILTKLQDITTLLVLAPYVFGSPRLENFLEHRSLAGLSQEEVHVAVRSFGSTPGPQPLPPPIKDTSAKLVNDKHHPFRHDRPGEIRGPCPGLNTLASHGYLPRNGVATPAQIISAVQEGFNMGWNFASFATYATFIVDGNHLTNLMSIGANVTTYSELTPGVNTHGTVEGDASTTRGDYYFGDNYSFNETLFEQLEYAAYQVGNGYITVESAALNKARRINHSIARNPTFWFDTPRWAGAYAETNFPLAFFVSNQTADTSLSATLDDARSFFKDHRFPDGFYRRQAPYDSTELSAMFNKTFPLIRVYPGRNEGVGNYVVNPEDDGSLCYAYQRQVNLTAQLYPNPTPELKAAIKVNLVTFYQTLNEPSCQQLFPYGQ